MSRLASHDATLSAASSATADFCCPQRQRFRHDYYGLPAGVVHTGWPPLAEALLQLWQQQQPALLVRLEHECFNRALPFAGSDWWWHSASQADWQHWHRQTTATWLVYQAACKGGQQQPRWPAVDTLCAGLAAEAAQLWYHWACLYNGRVDYPSASELSRVIQNWLGRMPGIAQLELELQLQPGIADGHQRNQQVLQQHWPDCQLQVAAGRWLPIRLLLQNDGSNFNATHNLALLCYQAERHDSVLCYEPLRGYSGRIFGQADRCWLELPDRSLPSGPLAVACIYPLADGCRALRPGLWSWVRQQLGFRQR